MFGKSCFFIGHRDAPDSVAEKLTETIEQHISDFSADCFTVGNYGRFDQLVQIALAEAKKRHPDIFIRMAVAYSPALGPVELPEGFEYIYFPANQRKTPGRNAIPHLNQTLVKESDFLIAYVCHTSGGSYKLLEYARRREKRGLMQITMLEA